MKKNVDALLEIAGAACSAAADARAEHNDVLVENSRSVTVEIEKNSIGTGDVEYDAGFSVRAFHKGGAGYARGSGLDVDVARESGAAAAAMARECEEDPDFVALPSPGNIYDVENLFDEEVAEFQPSKLIEMGLKCIEIAQEIAPGIIVKGGLDAGSSESVIVNSNGVKVMERATSMSYYVFCVARKGDNVGSYYEYTQGRRIADLKSPEEVAREAAEKALSFVDSRKMDSGEFPVVLGPLASAGFFRSIIGAADAEDIQRGRSYLAGKRGEKIGPELLSIEEDPLFPAGLYSSGADGEGVPKVKRLLLDKGILTTYLHNSYTANKSGDENTGHATRGSFRSNVGIGATNLTLVNGPETEAEIIGRISDGLYIYMGSIAPNPVTGQISGTVDFGFRIKNGKLDHPIENVMIGGDVFGFLDSVEAVSSDCREEPGNCMPAVLLGKIKVASG